MSDRVVSYTFDAHVAGFKAAVLDTAKSVNVLADASVAASKVEKDAMSSVALTAKEQAVIIKTAKAQEVLATREAATAQKLAAKESAAAQKLAAKEIAAAAAATSVAETEAAKVAVRTAEARKGAATAIGVGMMAAGGLIAAGLALGVKSGIDFGKQMSAVQAVSGATSSEFATLRDAALQAGKVTKFSATEAALGMTELSKAGVSNQNILAGGLLGALNLAAAANIDLGVAATYSAQAMNVWQLSGAAVPHIADVLTAAANKSAASVSDLGFAMQAGGNTAEQFQIPMEDFMGTIAMFADHALKGADAGTSFKTMMQALVNPHKAAAATLKEYNIQAFDAKGNFVGLASLAGELEAGLGGLSQKTRNAALAQIFGSDSMRVAGILYSAGKAKVEEYTRAVNDQGAAQRMSSIMMNNLSGDIENLRGSVETALIKSTDSATGGLRTLVQAVTNAFNWYLDLSPAAQGAATTIAASGAAALIAGGAFVTIVQKLGNLKEAMEALKISTSAIVDGLGLFALAAVGIASVAVLSNYLSTVDLQMQHLDGTTKDTEIALISWANGAKWSGGLDILGSKLQYVGSMMALVASGIPKDTVPSGIATVRGYSVARSIDTSRQIGHADIAFNKLDEGLVQLLGDGHVKEATTAFASLSEQASIAHQSYSDFTAQFPKYTQAVQDASVALMSQKDTVANASDAIERLAAKKDEERAATEASTLAETQQANAHAQSTKQIKAEIMALEHYNDAQIGSIDATIKIKTAQADMVIALRASHGQLAYTADQLASTNVKVVAFAKSHESALAAVINFALAIKGSAKAVYDSTGSTVAYTAKVAEGRAEMDKILRSFGLTKDAAKKLEDQLLKMPPIVTVQLEVVGVYEAQVMLDSLGRTITSLANGVSFVHLAIGKGGTSGRAVIDHGAPAAPMVTATHLAGHYGRGRAAFSTGGIVNGPGGPSSDSVPAWLSAGEYVINSAAVRSLGVDYLDRMNRVGHGSTTNNARHVTVNVTGQHGLTRRDVDTALTRADLVGGW